MRPAADFYSKGAVARSVQAAPLWLIKNLIFI